MRTFNIYIQRYDWLVRVFIAVSEYHIDEISDALYTIGCTRREVKNAINAIMGGKLNTGLCSSNQNERISVVVIKKTTSAAEFFNSAVHEITHLATHIAEKDGINMKGEEICYLSGSVAASMFPFFKDLLCECCRKKYRPKGVFLNH